MTNVIIHGELGKVFGTNHTFKLEKLIDVVRALNANNPGFKEHILSLFHEGVYYNMVNLKKPNQKWDSIEEYSKEEAPDEIHLVPEITGAGIVSAVVGAVSAIATAVGGVVAAVSLSSVGGFLLNLAVGLLIQGIMTLLFPVELPKTSAQTVETKIDTSSYIFTNLQNNAIQGFAIPLVYGEMRIGSNIIATNIVSEDLG
jgi:predicted phage tail protein